MKKESIENEEARNEERVAKCDFLDPQTIDSLIKERLDVTETLIVSGHLKGGCPDCERRIEVARKILDLGE